MPEYGWDQSPTPDLGLDKTKATENAQKLYKWVIEKQFGKDVASAYAQAILDSSITANEAEMIANEADQIAKTTRLRQDNLENETAQSVAQMEADKDAVIANATVDSEVILARGGKPTLQARLDETTAQLAQKANTSYVDTVGSQDHSSEERLLNAYRDINVPKHTSQNIFETSSAPHSFFPSIVRNTSGKLFSYYRKSGWHGVDVNAKIYCKESDDNGVTWTNERIVVDNIGFDPRDPDVLLASDGKIIIKWFDHNGTEVHSKIKISNDDGATFGADITLPKPPNYNGSMISTRGKFIEASGVFYICLYISDENKAYVVKSSDLVNWEFVSYIHENILLNETSLCYVESEQALYAISRQGKKTNENVRFQDYANKLFLSKSLDNGTTWIQSYELPVYGHAPVAVPLGDEILISYKNTYTLGNGNRYTLDICKLKNGKINGYPKTLAFATGEENFDVFYSDILVEDTEVFLAFYTYAHVVSKVALFVFNKEEMNKIDFNYNGSENSIDANGWRTSEDGIIEAWKEHTVTYSLQPDEKKMFNLTNVREFPTRPLGIQAYIAEAPPNPAEAFDNIIMASRIINKAGDIRVMLWNTNDHVITVNKIRTYTFGM